MSGRKEVRSRRDESNARFNLRNISKKKQKKLFLQATTDTARFSELSTRLFSLGQGDPGLDAAAQKWIAETDAKAEAERAQIDKEAARAKAAVSRDGVREATVALGDWHSRRGEAQAALRAFLRARDYCSGVRDVAEVCLKAAAAAAQAGSWAHVSSYASKAVASSSSSNAAAAAAAGDEDAAASSFTPVISSAAVATALAGCAAAAFDQGRWREAALGFIRAAEAADVDGGGVAGVGGGVSLDENSKTLTYPLDRDASKAPTLTSPIDIALCGGLACLASLDRSELSTIVLASAGFRDALSSLLPELLEAVEAAAAARFGDCLARLRSSVLPRARLDARASRAAPRLAAAAARRCLVQYAAPFSTLSLDVAKERLGFATRGELDEELASLVRKGAVKGKLDVPRGLLTRELGVSVSISANAGGGGGGGGREERQQQQQQQQVPSSAVDAALEAGLAYVADSRALLLRAAMLSKGMVEQAPAAAPATPAPAEQQQQGERTATPGAEGGVGGRAPPPPGRSGSSRRGRERVPEMEEPRGMSSGGEGEGVPPPGRASRRR